MSVSWVKRTLNVPFPLVLAAFTTLLVSLSVHIINFSLNLRVGQPVSTQAELPIRIRSATLTTVRSERFGLYSNESNWDTMLPKGDGFIYHPNDGKHYLVSHFHNLHCLRSFRHYLNIAMVSNPTYHYTSLDKGHVHHCLIYFRQMLLCNADLTLEPANHKQRTPEGKVADTVTGVGIKHRCVDWEQLWEYMESNYETYKDTYSN